MALRDATAMVEVGPLSELQRERVRVLHVGGVPVATVFREGARVVLLGKFFLPGGECFYRLLEGSDKVEGFSGAGVFIHSLCGVC